MIGQVVRHGRTVRDMQNLRRHLLKDPSAGVEMLNTVAMTLDEAMLDMMIARDGSRADAAFLHIPLSPSRDMSREELTRVANIVMDHFGASDHQAALVFHEKERSHGEGGLHAHLVLGRVGPEGHVIASGFEKIKLESAMRISEFELGEPCTLGRHHASGMKWLRKIGRHDVADFMAAAHGSDPEKPASAASPEKRQKLVRQGVDLADAQAAVRRAWEHSDNGKSFTQALAEEGLTVEPGQKTGVFVVLNEGKEIGALDRLLKLKRRDVAARMEGLDHDPEPQGPAPISDSRTRESDLSRDEKTAPIVEPSGASRTVREWADRSDQRPLRDPSPRSEAPAFVDGGSAHQGRRIDEIAAVKTLSEVRISADVIYAAQDIRMRVTSMEVSRFRYQKAVDQIDASTGWERLQHLSQRLLEAIKMTADRVRSFRIPPVPEYSIQDQQIADVFRKAAHGSAENIERLEALDPDLDRFRLHHGGEAFRSYSHDQILASLTDWRERSRHLNDLDHDDDHEYRGPRFT